MNRIIRSIEDMSTVAHQAKHVLTLFSGGLDSTYVLSLLAKLPCQVTALAVDLGDSTDQRFLRSITQRFGARLEMIDARHTFAEQAVLPAIQAQAKYLGIYPISSSLSRPIMAKYAVQIANELGCDAIIHTANQSQNSLRRLNGSIGNTHYQGYYGSPYEYSAIPREEKAEALQQQGLPEFVKRAVSGDSNLWCREFESGLLDNPESFHTPEKLFKWSLDCGSNVHPFWNNQISIRFEQGRPTAIDGVEKNLLDLIEQLNIHAGAYRIGRYAGLEHLEHGEKVLEIREAPAAIVLMDAYRHLETAVHDVALLQEKMAQEQAWCLEAINGHWDSPLHQACWCFIAKTTAAVTGSVTFTLKPGAAEVVSIQAEQPLYLTERDHWEMQAAFSRSQRTLSIHNTPAKNIKKPFLAKSA